MVNFYSSITLYHTDFLAGGLTASLWDRFEADAWTSEEMAHVLSRHPEAPRSLVPLQELFVPIQPAGRSEAYRETWEAEAELFVRWALSSRVRDGREKLQAFVSGCVNAQPSEQAFTAAFGLGYADALEALSDFLPAAVRDPVDLAYTPPRLEPPLEFRDATAVEVHRIKGDWSRRTLKLLRQSGPGSVAPFVEETRHLLQGPYDRGERDPRLLASLALFRIETGDQAGAAALLGSDPRVADARPLGEVELALWRLEQALAKPAGSGGTLSAAQAEGVLAPLDLARRQAPPIEATYLIAARVAGHSGHIPSAEDRARLNEGARLFPRNSILVMKSAAWDLRAGEYSTALQITALGLAASNDAETLAKLTTLRDLAARVATTAAPAPGS
jgi:hypothetical protein